MEQKELLAEAHAAERSPCPVTSDYCAMNKHSFACLTLLLGLATACQPRQTTETNDAVAAATVYSASAAHSFQTQTLQRQSERCSGDSCARISIQTVVAQGGPAPLRDSLNQYVHTYLLRQQLTTNPDADIHRPGNAAELVAAQFLKEYATFQQENEGRGASLGWELTIASQPIYQTGAFVSLRLNSTGYLGGAHGFNVTTLQSFDSTGRALRLREMVTDTVQLRKLTEREFRRVRQLPNTSFEEQGFFTQGQGLPFTENVALTAQGLLMYYNAYEVNAYAFGPTELLLPYAQLQGLLKSAYLPRARP